MDFLRVSPPPAPAPTVRRTDITAVKLARNVAVLFGVDVPENPTGVVWVCDFNRVAVGDVGRGGPKATRKDVGYLPVKGWYLAGRTLVAGPLGKKGDTGTVPTKPVRVDEIPAATLNRFAPDTKAAAILAGADTLFAQLEGTFQDTMRVLGTLDDGTYLADFMRVGIWASLIAELYRSQPALFTAAVQARLTQRATLSTWSPRLPRDAAAESAASEFGHHDEGKWEPTRLGVLDRVVRDYVHPSFGSATISGDDLQNPNSEYLIDGLVDRWCRHLTQSPDRGLAWTVQNGQCRTVEVHQSAQMPLGRFIAEVLLLSPKILPFATDDRDDWQTFDPGIPAHRLRARPRIPSLAELSPMPEKSKQAVVHTLICLHRVLRTNAKFNHKDMLKEVSEDQERVVETSETLWGKEAPLSLTAKLLWLRGRVSAGRESDADFADAHWPQLIECLAQLHRLRAKGHISVGEWIDLFSTTSPDINSRIRDLNSRGRTDDAKTLQASLLDRWKELLELLEINLGREIEKSTKAGKPDPSLIRVAPLLHNYIGVAMRSEDIEERLEAIRFGRLVVLPLRRIVAQDRGNDTAARQTIQIISGAAGRLAAETNNDSVRQEMLQLCANLLGDLLKTRLVLELLNEDRPASKAGDLNALNAVAETALNLLEARSTASPVNQEILCKIIHLAEDALNSLTGGKTTNPETASERARKVEQNKKRWLRLGEAE